MTPFQNRALAEKMYPYITGAFSITQIKNQIGWYIISQDTNLNYRINFKDGSYTVNPDNNPTFDTLKSRTTVETTINNSEVIV